MKPLSSTCTPAASAPTSFPLGRRPTATSTLSNTADCGALSPSKVTVSPSSPACTSVTFVLSQIASYCLVIPGSAA